MSKNKIVLLVTFLIIISIAGGIYLFSKTGGAEKSAPDGSDSQTTENQKEYPEELKPYVDAIRFFESSDWDSFKKMADICPQFTRDAFINSLYYLGRIDMDEYDGNQVGIQEINKNIEDAKNALKCLVDAENSEGTNDKYDNSQILSEAIKNMNSLKEKTDGLKEKYKKYLY